ncbi:MAG: M14 family zinc carboxypeptidase, partial [Emcibacteraceae bacterium]|nr:M14 family zinc carboxypeptidase [Emcibacteraceae bacterium]
EFLPGATFDPTIPTVEQVLGYKAGDNLTSPEEIIVYLEALAAAAPERVVLKEYGRTWQNRKLIYVAISNATNISKLDQISADMKRLANVRETDEAEADEIISNTVGITWLGHSVHGNEVSAAESSLQTAYHLLAATNQPWIDNIMQNSVVIIDPLINPDGRARAVNTYRENLGLEADSSGISAEHDEQWPGGRVNHYLFDMNRDWFALTQPETQGRVRVMQDFYPMVYIDLHEMGGNSTYFFSPSADPFNPNITQEQIDGLEVVGRNNARHFDGQGFGYFTREVYDAFYPGYGDQWPLHYGGMASTYEQASPGALVYKRSDGEELHYREATKHHMIAALSTAEAVANNGEMFLKNFYNYRLSGIERGEDLEGRYYIVPTQSNQSGADKFAGLMRRHGVEVSVANEAFRSCGVNYEAGTFILDAAQPMGRFVSNMMEDNIELDPVFAAEQERRRDNNLRDQIYDVTAWSLPLMYNFDVERCNSLPNVNSSDAGIEFFAPGMVHNPDATVAYLVKWGQASSARFLTHSLRAGLDVKSADMGFINLGIKYPAGSLILEIARNDDGLSEKLQKIAADTGADAYGVNDSWVSDGPSFGSGNTVQIHAPKIAMLWDNPTRSYGAGNARFVIERQFDYPVTVIRSDSIRSADLSPYQVIIMPEGGNYKSVLGGSGASNLKEWVSEGGTLIALGSAMRFTSDPDVDLMSVRREYAYRDEPKEAGDDSARVDGTLMTGADDYNAAIESQNANPDSVAGVIVKADVDLEHWLTAGVEPQVYPLYSGTD